MSEHALSLLDAPLLERLRAGFDEAVLVDGARLKLRGAFDGASPYVDGLIEAGFLSNVLGGKERELIILALQASTEEGFAVQIHAYWALMQGASPEAVLQCLTLVGIYAGVKRYMQGIDEMRALAGALAGLNLNDEAPIHTRAVLERLAQAS